MNACLQAYKTIASLLSQQLFDRRVKRVCLAPTVFLPTVYGESDANSYILNALTNMLDFVKIVELSALIHPCENPYDLDYPGSG